MNRRDLFKLTAVTATGAVFPRVPLAYKPPLVVIFINGDGYFEQVDRFRSLLCDRLIIKLKRT